MAHFAYNGALNQGQQPYDAGQTVLAEAFGRRPAASTEREHQERAPDGDNPPGVKRFRISSRPPRIQEKKATR